MKRHLHHVVLAWDGQEEMKMQEIQWVVTVTVDGCTTEKSALDRAKQYVIRQYYKLNSVRECQTCSLQALQEETLEVIKKAHSDNEEET